MALGELEQAFAENLILAGAVRATRLLYALRLREHDERPLWELVGHLQLASPSAIAEARTTAEAALSAAGASAFSFGAGAFVGPWELVEERGRSFGGEVWLARRGDELATLRLLAPGSGRDPVRTARFVERSNAGLAPPHPAILKIDEAAEDFGWLYAATVGLDFQTLAALRAQGPLDEATSIAIAQSLAGSLSVVHDLGVVHGGLNPLAVLVREQRTYVSDFGVGSTVLDGPVAGNRPGGRLGVLLYASPALVAGDEHRGLDARDDFYSLGALLLDCVSGPGAPEQRAAPDAPWFVEPPVGPGLRIVIARLLGAHPDGSYATARGVLEDLGRVAAGGLPGPVAEGSSVRGRRAEGAAPQQVLTAQDLLDASFSGEGTGLLEVAAALAAPAAEGTATDAAAPPPKAATPPSDAAGPIQAPRAGAPVPPQRKRPSYRAPKARASLAELAAKPSARRSGSGWALFFSTLLLVGVGAVAVHALTRPQGVLRVRDLYARVEAELAGEGPRYAWALERIDAALRDAPSAPAEVLRDGVALRARVLTAAEEERRRLWPVSSEPLSPPGDALRARINDFLLRAAGLPAEALLRYDLARAEKEQKRFVWGRLGDALLAAGQPAAALQAYRNGGSRHGQRRARLAREALVYLPGGPYLVPEAGGENLRVVFRAPCYVGRREVTRGEYGAFLAALADAAPGDRHRFCARDVEPPDKDHTPSLWSPRAAVGRDLPATGLDAFDAIAYAGWRRALVCDVETLEAAARGPLGLERPWGAAPPEPLFANFAGAFGALLPAGSLPGGAAPCGALDLLGNAAEWARRGEGEWVSFGGDFRTPPAALAPTVGEVLAPDTRRDSLGFRILLPVPAGDAAEGDGVAGP
ncbi:MAG: hypothetical protein D6731_14710 [Planctomycetota bacterium]|nr:MAG: hypothetical protein D6731_14710 [Planctomycetota bacterium]